MSSTQEANESLFPIDPLVTALISGKPTSIPFEFPLSGLQRIAVLSTNLFNSLEAMPPEKRAMWMRKEPGPDVGVVCRRPRNCIDISGEVEKEYKDYLHINALFVEELLDNPLINGSERELLRLCNKLYHFCLNISEEIFEHVRDVDGMQLLTDRIENRYRRSESGKLRILRYTSNGSRKLAEQHSDLGLFTLGLWDTHSALEYFQQSGGECGGEWMPVTRPRGHATLFAGDKLAILTGGRRISGQAMNDNAHKVIQPGHVPTVIHRVGRGALSESEFFSVVFFYHWVKLKELC